MAFGVYVLAFVAILGILAVPLHNMKYWHWKVPSCRHPAKSDSPKILNITTKSTKTSKLEIESPPKRPYVTAKSSKTSEPKIKSPPKRPDVTAKSSKTSEPKIKSPPKRPDVTAKSSKTSEPKIKSPPKTPDVTANTTKTSKPEIESPPKRPDVTTKSTKTSKPEIKSSTQTPDVTANTTKTSKPEITSPSDISGYETLNLRREEEEELTSKTPVGTAKPTKTSKPEIVTLPEIFGGAAAYIRPREEETKLTPTITDGTTKSTKTSKPEPPPKIPVHAPELTRSGETEVASQPTSKGACGKGIIRQGLNKTEVSRILDIHNRCRNRVARGLEKRGKPGPQPGSENLKPLTWSKKLAVFAQDWANKCVFKHDRESAAGELYGQNLAYDEATLGLEFRPPFKSVIDWYNEVQYFNNTAVASFKSTISSHQMIGHYTQVVWGKTTEIGCGITEFKMPFGWKHRFLVCYYSPSGNVIDEPVYEATPSNVP